MKILIVSGAFFPQNSPRSFRTTQLVKELARQGHEVRVYIPNIKYDFSELLKEYKTLDIRLCINLTWNDIKLDSTGLKYWIHRIIRRILIYFLEYPSIQWYLKMPQILKNENGYDLLISIAVPHPIHWGIAKCIKKGMNFSDTWVADCGDPYMGCQTASYKPPFYFSYLEKSFCKRADFITVPIESAKMGYYFEFRNKIKVVPQAFNFDEVIVSEKYVPNEIITFGYAGSFVPGEREPRSILEYLAKINLDFRFIVYTMQRKLIKDFIPILGEKMVLKEYLSREQLLFEMSKMDFLLNIENDSTVQRPSKLIDYALTKRPILSVNSQQINKEKIIQFLNRDYSQQYVVNNIEDYNIKNVTNKFLELAKHKHVK